MASPLALVVPEPLVDTEPDTANLTTTFGSGKANWLVTFAFTQCCEPTTFVAVAGVRSRFAGWPNTHVFVADATASQDPSAELSAL